MEWSISAIFVNDSICRLQNRRRLNVVQWWDKSTRCTHAHTLIIFVFCRVHKAIKIVFVCVFCFLCSNLLLCMFCQWLKANDPNSCALHKYAWFAQATDSGGKSTSYIKNTHFLHVLCYFDSARSSSSLYLGESCFLCCFVSRINFYDLCASM